MPQRRWNFSPKLSTTVTLKMLWTSVLTAEKYFQSLSRSNLLHDVTKLHYALFYNQIKHLASSDICHRTTGENLRTWNRHTSFGLKQLPLKVWKTCRKCWVSLTARAACTTCRKTRSKRKSSCLSDLGALIHLHPLNSKSKYLKKGRTCNICSVIYLKQLVNNSRKYAKTAFRSL